MSCRVTGRVSPQAAQAVGGASPRICRRSIGIDDGKRRREPCLVSSEAGRAGEFQELFRAVYLTFHR